MQINQKLKNRARIFTIALECKTKKIGCISAIQSSGKVISTFKYVSFGSFEESDGAWLRTQNVVKSEQRMIKTTTIRK